MTPNFDALYEAAQESRAQIAQAIADCNVKCFSGEKWCLLEVGDFINYRTLISPVECKYKTITLSAIPYSEREQRDCTVDEIRECTAKTIAAIRRCSREGRIAELEEELAKLKGEEE